MYILKMICARFFLLPLKKKNPGKFLSLKKCLRPSSGDVLQHFETFRLYAPTRTEICRDMDGTIPLQQTLPPDMPLTPQLRRELDKMGLTERPREGVKTFRVDQVRRPVDFFLCF